jgi:hypothetical protein
MNRLVPSIALLAVAATAACSPTLDWREFVPAGTDLSVSFPCRPDRQARSVVLAGEKARMEMLACHADGATFAIAFVDVTDPARVGTVLADLRATAVANLQGTAPEVQPLQVKGMTPNPQAARISVAGALPDGAPVQAHAAFFTRGLRIYQATVIGAKPTAFVVDAFVSGLNFPG